MSLPNLIQFCRDNADKGAALHAWRSAGDPSFTLTIGKGLGADSRPGAILARLLAQGNGPWVLVSVSDPVGVKQREAAARLHMAAEVVGVALDAVCLVSKVSGRVEIVGGGL